MTEMYLQGEIPQLCEAMDAALGKIDVEVRELKPQGSCWTGWNT